MTNLYVSPDLTAFVSTRQVERWQVGVIAVLLGDGPSRVEEECLALRDTAGEALQDAQLGAKAVIAAWRDKVKL